MKLSTYWWASASLMTRPQVDATIPPWHPPGGDLWDLMSMRNLPGSAYGIFFLGEPFKRPQYESILMRVRYVIYKLYIIILSIMYHMPYYHWQTTSNNFFLKMYHACYLNYLKVRIAPTISDIGVFQAKSPLRGLMASITLAHWVVRSNSSLDAVTCGDDTLTPVQIAPCFRKKIKTPARCDTDWYWYDLLPGIDAGCPVLVPPPVPFFFSSFCEAGSLTCCKHLEANH